MTHILFAFFLDILFINSGFILSFLIRYPEQYRHPAFEVYVEVAPFLTLIYVLSFIFAKIYKKKFLSYRSLCKRVFYGLLLGTFVSICFIYVFRTLWGVFPSGVFVTAFCINLFLVMIIKVALYKSRGKIFRNVKFIGAHELDDFLLSKEIKDFDEIVLTSEVNDIRGMFLLIGLARDFDMKLSISSGLYEKLLNSQIHGQLPVYFLLPVYLDGKNTMQEVLIRGLDIVGAIIGLVLSCPFFLVLGIMIKLDSSGPVLYKQKRLGKNGKVFTIYKFRTMQESAEKETGPVLASSADPRITKIGRFLRATRLDEIPQLINVLKGDMSLVGPRPERLHFIKKHSALSGIRLSVKPGLTGFAQIRSSYDLKPVHKLKYDYLYIRKRSVFLNLKLLVKTIPVVLLRKGT